MARREYKGAAVTAHLTGPITATTLSISIDATAGWPTGGANGKFYCTIGRGLAGEEQILVQSRSGGTLTVASTGDRGVDDTTAGIWAAGTEITHGPAADDFDEANQHINDAAQDHHTQYMKADGTRHDLTARHPAGTVVPTAAPVTAITPDAAGAEGAGTTLARSTHIHPISTIAPVAVGTALAEGAGNDFSRSTHVHTVGAGAINLHSMLASPVFAWYVQAGDPGAVGANALWFDTTARAIKVRNAANAAWVVYVADPVANVTTWTNFTPTFPSLVIGNSIVYGRYTEFPGRTVVGFAGFEVGSTGNVTASPIISYTLPYSHVNLVGPGMAGARAFTGASGRFASVGTIEPNASSASSFATAGQDPWDGTHPANWAPGDQFRSFFIMEKA